MKINKVGIIMNGVTGRMGTNQHLYRSLAAIIKAGGLRFSDEEVILPELVLVGRNAGKLAEGGGGGGVGGGDVEGFDGFGGGVEG